MVTTLIIINNKYVMVGVNMSKVTIGIIGAGRIGKLHATNLIGNPEVRVKTISDLYADNIREWASQIGVNNVVVDYEKVISDSEIDAIFICTPTDMHIPIIREAAVRGKHIFCEKPISFSIQDTKEVIEYVNRFGIKFQVGFNRRFDRNFSKIREKVNEGLIGDVHILKITSRDPAPPPIDYIKSSGGLFMDMSIHDFDMARFITGSEVIEVSAHGMNLIDSEIADAGDIDTAVTILKFANGALGVIDNSRKAVYGYDQRVEVFGSKGCIVADNERETNVEISTETGVYKDKLKYFFLERYKDAYIIEANAFVQSILKDTPVLCNSNDGLQAELIAEAAKLSFKSGKPIKLDTICV